MDAHAAKRMATGVGVATTAIGGVLAAAPDRVGALAGIDDDAGLRAIGIADLALVPGLVAGRPRWPWMAARAALNVAIGAYLVATADEEARIVPTVAAAALLGVTTQDLRAARALHAAGE